MRVVRRDGFVKQSGDDYTVAEAVEASLLATNPDTRSKSSATLEVVKSSAKALSVVIGALADRGMLSKNTVSELLSYDYQVED